MRGSAQHCSAAKGLAAILILILLVPIDVLAVEGGAGVYLLGRRGPLPIAGVQANEVDAQALINVAQVTWVTDQRFRLWHRRFHPVSLPWLA